MSSFKAKLRNLINTTLVQNQNINLEDNLNKSIIDTQRKIKNNINSESTTSVKIIQKINLENNLEKYSKLKEPLTNNNSSTKSSNKNRIYDKINLEILSMNNITLNKNSRRDKEDINKKYKNLYHNSYMNLSNCIYNNNKAYLNYKNTNNNILNKYKQINVIKTKNINIYNYKRNNKAKQNNSTSYKNLMHKNENLNDNCKMKEKNFKSNKNINYLELYDNFIHKNNKNVNDIYIIRNKKRISSSIRKKINLIIGENSLEKFSHKDNISNKLPRTLDSELYQFDYQYYYDISPITNFINLNEKNKKGLKINIKYNNKHSINHLLNYNNHLKHKKNKDIIYYRNYPIN